MLRIFSAFTGVGSPEMAIRNINLDYEVVGISEVDRYALLAYNAIHCTDNDNVTISDAEMCEEMMRCNIAYNFSTGVSEMPKKSSEIKALYQAHINSRNFGDIRGIDVNTLPEMDLFSYSFPCKNISIAGGQGGFEKGSGTQSSLLWECQRIIEAKKPKYLIMENVKNLVGKSHKPMFDEWISYLDTLGYMSEYKVLNATHFGLPQNRERVIMVSVLGEDVKPLYGGVKTESSIIDIMETDHIPDGLFYDDDDYTIDQSIQPTGGKLTQVGQLNGNPRCRTRIYSASGYSPTMDSMTGGGRQPKVYMDGVARRLTQKECWRLMGFSDTDFDKASKVITKSKLYERAGRGIAVPMLESVFLDLFKGKYGI